MFKTLPTSQRRARLHDPPRLEVLKGFDRLLFRGHLPRLNFPDGVESFLRRQGVLKKDFGDLAEELTTMIRDEAESTAAMLGRPAVYLESSTVRKEEAMSTARRRSWTAWSPCPGGERSIATSAP